MERFRRLLVNFDDDATGSPGNDDDDEDDDGEVQVCRTPMFKPEAGSLLMGVQAEQSPYVAESQDSGDAQSQEVMFGDRWRAVFFMLLFVSYAVCSVFSFVEHFCRIRQRMSGATATTGRRILAGGMFGVSACVFKGFTQRQPKRRVRQRQAVLQRADAAAAGAAGVQSVGSTSLPVSAPAGGREEARGPAEGNVS